MKTPNKSRLDLFGVFMANPRPPTVWERVRPDYFGH
jgi:hypothetical protein